MKMSSVCELDGEEPDWAGIYWREGVGLPFGDCCECDSKRNRMWVVVQ